MRLLLESAALMLAGVTILSYLGKLNYIFELLSHFRWHLAILFLLSAATFGVLGLRAWVAFALLGALINVAIIIPWYIGADEQGNGGDHNASKVLIANVERGVDNVQAVSALIDEERPDLLGLIEVTTRWLDDFTTLRHDYSNKFEFPQDDNSFGLALYSKLPISDARVVQFGDTAMPVIVATLAANGGEFEIILAHPMLPTSAERSASRNAQLREMARYVRDSAQAVMVAGDLNVTMWSPYYRDFVEQADLKNAREGYGIGATFPASFGAFGIPIDHILINDPSAFREFRVHRNVGSDHRPISAEVVILSGRE